jgi:hypothetical protein
VSDSKLEGVTFHILRHYLPFLTMSSFSMSASSLLESA